MYDVEKGQAVDLNQMSAKVNEFVRGMAGYEGQSGGGFPAGRGVQAATVQWGNVGVLALGAIAIVGGLVVWRRQRQ